MTRNILLFAFVIFTLQACTGVYFESPQPKNSNSISNFDKSIQGHFSSCDSDTLVITDTKILLKDKSSNNNEGLINDNVILRQLNNYLVINIKDSVKSQPVWQVMLIQFASDSLKLICTDLPVDSIKVRLKGITPFKEIKNNEGKTTDFLIDPDSSDFRKLIQKGLFNKTLSFKRISFEVNNPQ